MKRFLKGLALVAIVLLWLPVLALALEWGARIQMKWIERSNPYILATTGARPWPDAQEHDFKPPPAKQAPPRTSQPEPASAGPDEYRRSHEAWRLPLFADLNDEERCMFAQTFSEYVAVFERDGTTSLCYGAPPAGGIDAKQGARVAGEVFPEAANDADNTGPKVIERVFATGSTEHLDLPWRTPNGPVVYPTIFFPIRDANGATAHVAAAVERPFEPLPGGSNWVIPFFVFRDNTGKTTRVFNGMDSFMNNKGFRDDDVVLPKPEGVFRIVCIGASTTFEGNTNASTYPNLLEERLNEALPERKFDVVNCGVVGITSLGEWLRFQDYLDLDPDLIVYYDGVNDLCHWLFQNWVFEAAPWQKRARESQFINLYLNRWLLPPPAVMKLKIEQKVFKSLRGMAKVAHDRQIPMAFCSFAYPNPSYLSRAERQFYDFNMRRDWGGKYVTFSSYCRAMGLFNECVRTLCSDTGALYVPVAENIRGGGKCFGDICHMKDDGIVLKTDIIARTLLEYLRTRLNSPKP